jgi:hypothetical protein
MMNVINVDKDGNIIDDLTKVVLPPDLQEVLNNAVSNSKDGLR